jgi:hypothetical protein
MYSEDETQPTRVNYIKRNLDKVIYFAFGNGFTPHHPRHQNDVALAMKAWNGRLVERLIQAGQFGSVTGDVFLMVAPVKRSVNASINPRTFDMTVDLDAPVRIAVINSSYCIPEYHVFDRDVLLAMNIIVPINASGVALTQPFGGLSEASSLQYQWLRITNETVQSWKTDGSGKMTDEKVTTQPNPIGEIFVRHIRNFPFADSLFGMDDVTEVRRLNEEITASITDIGEIIKYHGHPITILKGFKRGNLKKGPNKIWSNIPKDGAVENLELKSDLSASTAHVKELKEDLHALMSVPEIAQGTKQAISNTSGVALQTMYLPLGEKASTKQRIYTPELIEVLILVLKWLNKLDKMEYIDDAGKLVKRDMRRPMDETYYEDIRLNTRLRFPSPLPRDIQAEVVIQSQLLDKFLQTTEGALAALGEEHPADKLADIAKDVAQRRKLQQQLANTEDTGNGAKKVVDDNDKGMQDTRHDPEEGTPTQQQGRPRTTNAGEKNNGE